MKKYFRTALLTILATLGIAACSDKNSDGPDNGAGFETKTLSRFVNDDWQYAMVKNDFTICYGQVGDYTSFKIETISGDNEWISVLIDSKGEIFYTSLYCYSFAVAGRDNKWLLYDYQDNGRNNITVSQTNGTGIGQAIDFITAVYDAEPGRDTLGMMAALKGDLGRELRQAVDNGRYQSLPLVDIRFSGITPDMVKSAYESVERDWYSLASSVATRIESVMRKHDSAVIRVFTQVTNFKPDVDLNDGYDNNNVIWLGLHVSTDPDFNTDNIIDRLEPARVKVTHDSGDATYAITVEGLDPDKQYCFQPYAKSDRLHSEHYGKVVGDSYIPKSAGKVVVNNFTLDEHNFRRIISDTDITEEIHFDGTLDYTIPDNASIKDVEINFKDNNGKIIAIGAGSTNYEEPSDIELDIDIAELDIDYKNYVAKADGWITFTVVTEDDKIYESDSQPYTLLYKERPDVDFWLEFDKVAFYSTMESYSTYGDVPINKVCSYKFAHETKGMLFAKKVFAVKEGGGWDDLITMLEYGPDDKSRWIRTECETWADRDFGFGAEEDWWLMEKLGWHIGSKPIYQYHDRLIFRYEIETVTGETIRTKGIEFIPGIDTGIDGSTLLTHFEAKPID